MNLLSRLSDSVTVCHFLKDAVDASNYKAMEAYTLRRLEYLCGCILRNGHTFNAEQISRVVTELNTHAQFAWMANSRMFGKVERHQLIPHLNRVTCYLYIKVTGDDERMFSRSVVMRKPNNYTDILVNEFSTFIGEEVSEELIEEAHIAVCSL